MSAPETRTVPCDSCGGDRGWDVPYDIGRRDGSLVTYWRECTACDDAGEYEVELQPIEMGDLP